MRPVYSVSDLETCLKCPYRYYAQSVLNLKPPLEWEIEPTPPEIGSLMHRVLEVFLASESNLPRCQADVPHLQEKLLEYCEQELALFRSDRPKLSSVLLEHHRLKIRRTLSSFVEDMAEEISRQTSLRPKFLEWKFTSFILPDGQGGDIHLRGRIDRIDVDEERKRFLIYDYKTGSTRINGAAIRRGESLQLPLYVLAVQQTLLPDYEPIGALYYHLSDMTKKDGLVHADRLPESLDLSPRSKSFCVAEDWERTFQVIVKKTQEIVAGIEAGQFESLEEECDPYCPYRDICKLRNACPQTN